ncbi:unnamed protein product [Calypogeia fissa]
MEPELTTKSVLQRDIPWETYMTAKLITGTGLQLLRRYDHKPENVQAALLDENGVAYVKVFVGILRDISKEDTQEYILAVIDDMLSANPKRARIFHDKFLESINIYDPFLRLLLKRKWFIQETSCKILTLMISARPVDFQYSQENSQTGKQQISDFDKTLRALVDWLCGQLKHPSHPTRGIASAISSLATILRENKVRELLLKCGGVKLLADLISPASTHQYVQLLYEAILCMWLLTYYDPVFEAMTEAQVVPRLVEVVKVSTKEKVTRVALLSLRNLVTKGLFVSELVKLGFLKIIQNTRLQPWTDEDLKEALDVLESAVEENLKDLNSFEAYKEEVLSGFLDWTPMHKDPNFWHKNCKKFEADDCQVLRILISILEHSRNPRTLAVACQDIYQFIGSHPTGRHIISSLNAKHWVMRLMVHDSPEVAREALLCAQRIFLSPKYADCIE